MGLVNRPVELPIPEDHDNYDEEHYGLKFDSSRCQSGDCVAEPPSPIGFYLEVHPVHDYEICEWGLVFRLSDGKLVCEDCAIIWEEHHQ